MDIESIKQKALDSIDKIKTSKELDDIKVMYLGKKSEITSFLQSLKDLTAEDKKKFGMQINEARNIIEERIKIKKDEINSQILSLKLKNEMIDVTINKNTNNVGHIHPCTKVYNEVRDIFVQMGYEVITGPEIEFDEYNFEKLNIEKGHPARDEQDTFYINDKILLRTQTSPVQARVMEVGKLPIKMISPGRVYRSDSVDATHSPTFHQIEGLVVSDNITFTDLKGTLVYFAKAFFGNDIKTRFRPHHFPFTEPSAEMDVSCFKCGGKGCKFCKNEGWIEILGCGMVNPHVYELCNLDKDKCQGFAFGIGIERLALLKYEIDDMRLLYENDVRFLQQF